MIIYRPSEPKASQWNNGVELNGFDLCYLGLSALPKGQIVVVSIRGEVFSFGGGEGGNEETLNRESRRGTIWSLKTIDNKLYAAACNRSVGVKEGIDNWSWLTADIPYNTGNYSEGFDDVDGFSAKDLYAVGGKGDVWHYNGKTWRAVNFPAKDELATVCCGADGKVYISGASGVSFVGREDRWQKIDAPNLPFAFKDMLWYESKVWCTNAHGVWWIEGDKLMQADIPNSVKVCAGNLSTRDGVLMLAGFGGAAMLENGEWNTLFHYSDMVEQCKKSKK